MLDDTMTILADFAPIVLSLIAILVVLAIADRLVAWIKATR